VIDFFDYATILLRIDALNRQIHDNILEMRYEDNLPLTQELLVQSRYLHLWHIQQMESHGHRNNRL
jgi:hypothetical protein